MDMNAPPAPPPPPPPPPPFFPPLPPLPPRPPGPPGAHRRLRRDRGNGILGGVCAGIAETYGLDITLVRVLWVIAGVMWIGVPAYVVAWIAIPSADGPIERSRRPRDTGMLLGFALVAIGITVASNQVLPHGFRFDRFGAPLLLIGGGLAILLLRRRSDDPDDFMETHEFTAPPASESPTPSAEPAEEPAPTPWATTTETRAETPTETTTEAPAVPPSAWTQTAEWPAQPSARSLRRTARTERRARRPRSFLTPVTLSVLLIGAGIASLLEATGALDVNPTVVLAIGTCVVGAALVTAAFFGRAHTLIFVGLVLLAATATMASLDVPLRGGIGSRHYRPVHLSELQQPYRLGVGDLRIDLRELPLADRTTTVDAELGVGHLVVFVPNSVRVEARGHAGTGSVKLFGFQQGGWPEDDEHAAPGTGAGVLELDLRVGAGLVEVRRFDTSGFETILGDN